ncbi:hypothetical protein [Burkholderia ubonensis]|uniref:hypothetical protein n=2 Tax=Burkholderia ubonensis TaxID=101571 RepID=UPI0007590D31|nr:hypothetical protein [Burkholderia ubonensis]
MHDVNRKLSPKAKQVLCAFAELKEDAQQAFNGALNEYLLASPTRRRQLIKQWQESVDTAERRDFVGPAAQAASMA